MKKTGAVSAFHPAVCVQSAQVISQGLRRNLKWIRTCSFFFKIYLFDLFGCIGSSLLRAAFSSFRERGLLFVVVRTSHCRGFSCCGARALGAWTSVVAACGLSSCGTRAQ